MKQIFIIAACLCLYAFASAEVFAHTSNDIDSLNEPNDLPFPVQPVFSLNPARTMAQTACDGLDFMIAGTAVTHSTCLSNGSITVTISDATSNVSGLEYGLSSTSGFTVSSQPSNVFQNIPPGTYTVSVRAFCDEDVSYSVVKTVSNVEVGGNYKVTQTSFNAASSRKSYSTCGTGIIALNVTDGSGSFIFNIVAAPGGVTPGEITPAQSGTVYTLPGQNWPAGDYQISVDDGCYTAMVYFNLGAISGLPAFSSENYQGFRADLNNTKGSCNYVGWSAFSYNLVSGNGNYNSDYAAYFNAGMYEIGMAPAGTGVGAVTNWTTWTTNMQSSGNDTNGYLYFNLSPKSISDFYSTNFTTAQLLTVFLRVKGCSTAYKSFTTSIKPPTTTAAFQSPSIGCNYITVKPWYNYDGVFCYPLTLTIKTAAGSLLYQKSGWVYNTDNATQIPFNYDAGPYTITLTDPKGTSASYPVNVSYSNSFYNVPYCGYYSPYFSVPPAMGAKPGSCYPWAGIVTVTDQTTGTVIGKDTVYDNSFHLLRDIQMQYNKNYTVNVQYPNGTSSTVTRNLSAAAVTPTVTVSISRAESYCYVNYGALSVNVPSGQWPEGTTFAVTGPDGYTSQTDTVMDTFLSNYTFPFTTLPPGQYTITYDLGGSGCPNTVTLYNQGICDYSNFGYSSQRTCSGMEITPTGNITYQGNITTAYFQLIDGPVGYDNSTISPGESIMLYSAGTYTLGIMSPNSTGECAIATQTINYTADPLSLDANFTSAYVCAGSKIGDISVKAINGVIPYIYELWDADNTVRLIPPTSSDDSVHFEYGDIDSTYTVRVSDACGNHFNQQVTLSDLSEPRIVYSLNNTVCQGGTIDLKCITLGTTEYNWTGPNGYTSTDQNPTIENVDSSMTGWYKVEVIPEFCDASVKDSTYVTVFTMVADTAFENQEICVLIKPSALSNGVTGGSGNYTYQWQSSADSVSWTDITEATEATYQPAAQTKSGTYYYRCVTTDITCNTIVNGNALTVVVKSCFVPVNPNLRSLPKR